MLSKEDAAGIASRARVFLAIRKTLMLATADMGDRAGNPTASYAPFVREGTHFYIYVSTLSAHTHELRKTRKAGVLVIEDEEDAKNNLFARTRISCFCVATVVKREGEEWQRIMREFQMKFGKVFDMILPLQDFILFSLTPYETLYIEGFGRAYQMDADLSNPVHVRRAGHTVKK
ncbi:MAG TPA: pyridoxamine 5'-phosphate oxidase family protein [Candidatus Paceibacterota bacterium]